MTQFVHDCKHCVYLGAHYVSDFDPETDEEIEKMPVDLYYCAKEETPALSSFLARFGDECSEYLSSHSPEAFADGVEPSSWEKEIIKRAKERGIYIQPLPEKRMLPCRGCGERFLFTTKEEHYCSMACSRRA